MFYFCVANIQSSVITSKTFSAFFLLKKDFYTFILKSTLISFFCAKFTANIVQSKKHRFYYSY